MVADALLLGSSVRVPSRFFLSAALSPHVQGASRWTAVNAKTRKGFAIAGKDGGSPLLAWLASGRPVGGDRSAFTTAVAQLGLDESLGGAGYLGWYRALNADYPFLDYAEPDALASDSRLMAAYATEAEAPPYRTPWPQAGRCLPPGRISCAPGPDPLSVELLAAWLQIAAGFTGTRDIRNLRIAHRTSPSGGARHPTELLIQVGREWQRALNSTHQLYWYDGAEHALCPSDAPPSATALGDEALRVTIVGHVRRPMWRYRDVRALRPVVIDAGHVVETLLTAVHAAGWQASWRAEPGTVVLAGDLDPTFGSIAINSSTDFRQDPEGNLGLFDRFATTSGPYRTNPLLNLFPTADTIRAEVPSLATTVELSPAMIDALAYATPSSRGDRPTLRADLLERFALTDSQLDGLCETFLLLDANNGDDLWSTCRSWFKHGWLPSLIAHLASPPEASREPGRERKPTPTELPADLPTALDRRRTSRNFTGQLLEQEELKRALDAAQPMQPCIKVAVLREGSSPLLGRGVHMWDGRTWAMLRPDPPSAEDIVKVAIGQSWATGFDAIFVIFPTGGPGHWEDGLLEAGRLAQRIALAVCGADYVGVFQSPALVDDLLGSVIPDVVLSEGAYLVGAGVVDATTFEMKRNVDFVPSNLFRTRLAAIPTRKGSSCGASES